MIGLSGGGKPQIVNLENIGPGGMGISAETPFDAGDRAKIRADGFEAEVAVVFCNVRENDFAVGLRFENGFQWSPAIWTPDHLLAPPAAEDR